MCFRPERASRPVICHHLLGPRASNRLPRPHALASEKRMLRKGTWPPVARQTPILSARKLIRKVSSVAFLPGTRDPLDTVFDLEKLFRLNKNIQSSTFSSSTTAGFPPFELLRKVMVDGCRKKPLGGNEDREEGVSSRRGTLARPRGLLFLRSCKRTRILKSSSQVTPALAFGSNVVTKDVTKSTCLFRPC